jgi:hypothetical protein
MATIAIKVESFDRDGRTVDIQYAYGNTLSAAHSAAGAVARQMTHQHYDHPLGPIRTKINRAVRYRR